MTVSPVQLDAFLDLDEAERIAGFDRVEGGVQVAVRRTELTRTGTEHVFETSVVPFEEFEAFLPADRSVDDVAVDVDRGLVVVES